MDAWIGWLVFAVVGLLIIGFSYGFIAYYKMRGEPAVVTVIIGFLSLLFTLLSLFLIPIDIYMAKNKDNYGGSGLRNEMKWTYYSFDIIFMIFLFIGLPFAYFYYEELGDIQDSENTFRKKACNALKYTIATAIVWTVLMIIGLFIDFKNTKNKKDCNTSDADQDNAKCWKSNVTNKFSSNSASILPFCMAVLMCIGLFFAMIYTAWGMAYLPISLMKSMPVSSNNSSDKNKKLDVELKKIENDLEMLYTKYRGRDEWEKRDEIKKRNLERKKRRLERKTRSVNKVGSFSSSRHGSRSLRENSYSRNSRSREENNNVRSSDNSDCCGKCGRIIWNLSAPIRYLIGISLIAFSLLLIVSMLIHLLDQTINSPCGYSCGFSVRRNKFFNPIDELLQKSSKYFPIDYILFSGVIFWLFLTTVSGLMAIDVRFLCFKLFSLRPHDTMHNALMMAVGFVVLVVASLTYMTYNLAPNYVSYGSQGSNCENSGKNGCTATAVYYILNSITIGMPIFGLVYYCFTWIFILVFLLSAFINISKKTIGKKHTLLDDDDDLEAIFKD